MAKHSRKIAREMQQPLSAPAILKSNFGGGFTPTFSADQHVGTALRETYRSFARSLTRNLAPLGLNLNSWFILRALWEKDGETQIDLAKRLDITPAGVVGVLNGLELVGLAKRKRSETDRRVFRVYLTESARRLRRKAAGHALQVDAKALRGLSVDEVNTLLRLMGKLRSNLAEPA